MKIAIVGAGITGLTAGYRLSKQGHRVTLFEKEKFVGGLASGFKEPGWNWSLEKFYHHLFTSDNDIKKLLRELGLSEKLFYQKAKTSILASQGTSLESFEFDSPFSLLRFSPLSLPNRLRTGLVTLYLKLLSNWQPLEQITAYSWLQKYYGKKVFRILWQPLLVGKFGTDAKSIPMSWFWARIKKRSAKLGYLEGGFQILIDKLVEKIKKNGGEIHLGYEIRGEPDKFSRSETSAASPREVLHRRKFPSGDLSEFQAHFDKVILTTSPQIFFPDLKAPEMLGALNLILTLKKQFLTDDTYWLNINDPSFPFVAVVEHTNLINPKNYGGNHILYAGGYYTQNHPFFKMSAKEILAIYLPYLQKINPSFEFQSLNVSKFKKFSSLYAQPIVPLNYSQTILPYQSPIPNVFLANMSQVYPWDRGTNYSVELGEKIAKIVQS